MLNDLSFWFSEPLTVLHSFDITLGYVFAALIVASAVLRVLAKFNKTVPTQKLLKRLASCFLTVGILGLLWFGFRYENTPLLSKRMIPGLIILFGLGWISVIVKYAIWKLGQDKQEFEANIMKDKYIPKAKR